MVGTSNEVLSADIFIVASSFNNKGVGNVSNLINVSDFGWIKLKFSVMGNFGLLI